MLNAIIGFIVILCALPLNGFERRRSFDRAEQAEVPSPMSVFPSDRVPSPEFKKPEPLPTKEFNFYEHYINKHTKTVIRFDEGVAIEEMCQVRDRLVSYRADHYYGTLHEAAIADDAKGIERMLQAEYHKKSLNKYNAEGQTPLQCAVDYSCCNAIECLIKHGALADLQNKAGKYSAWTLAQAYAESIAYMNVVPLMALQQALSKKGELHKYRPFKKKRSLEEKKIPYIKPSRMIKLRRRAARNPTPPLEDEEYDSYLLNV
jgi:hypothetical protein